MWVCVVAGLLSLVPQYTEPADKRHCLETGGVEATPAAVCCHLELTLQTEIMNLLNLKMNSIQMK